MKQTSAMLSIARRGRQMFHSLATEAAQTTRNPAPRPVAVAARCGSRTAGRSMPPSCTLCGSMAWQRSNVASFRDFTTTTTTTDKDEEERLEVLTDLFQFYAKDQGNGLFALNEDDARAMMMGHRGLKHYDNEDNGTFHEHFDLVDQDKNGLIDLQEFLEHADFILDGNPARIILVVGGPGSGKGVLSRNLQEQCNVVHLSSGNMLREEVAAQTQLGKQVERIIAKGELVSSAIMVALMKRRMKNHPGKRVLLDGFPRSLENASDLVDFCGKPELALHLVCDDTVLLERIIGRGMNADSDGDKEQQQRREDDNFQTALERLRTFHKYHPMMMEWLRDQHVPIINLDCSGPSESVWEQLQAIGRLMRPAVKLPTTVPK